MSNDVMVDIPGFEELYAIYPDGRVWSYPKYNRMGKFLKPGTSLGYQRISIMNTGGGFIWKYI